MKFIVDDTHYGALTFDDDKRGIVDLLGYINERLEEAKPGEYILIRSVKKVGE